MITYKNTILILPLFLTFVACGMLTSEGRNRRNAQASTDVLEAVVGEPDPDQTPGSDANPSNRSTPDSSGQDSDKLVPPLNSKCDMTQLKAVVSANCSLCHGGETRVGNYSIEGEWRTDSLPAQLAVTVMLAGNMPPPGRPRLSDGDFAAVNQCKPLEDIPLEARPPTSSVETQCPTDIPEEAGQTRARLLSSIEIRNSIASAVGTSSMATLSDRLALVPTTDTTQAFSSQTTAATRLLVDSLAILAEAVAQLLASQQTVRQILVPCLATLPASVSGTCRDMSLQLLARTFYRRPPTASESARLLSVWGAGMDTESSLILVVRFLLQTPGFVYLAYQGIPTGDPKVFDLTPHEVAQRLSYWLTKAPPDAPLARNADNGSLLNPDVIKSEVVRLLGSTAGRSTTRMFASEWLGLEYMTSLPIDQNFLGGIDGNGLPDEMREEILHLVEKTVNDGGSFADLMLSRKAKVTDRLASLYGMDGVATTSPIDLDDDTRAGLLTRAGLHIRGLEQSPYHLAMLVRERILDCAKLEPPPAGATDALGSLANVPRTYRQKFESVTLEPACIGCHNLLNAPAFAFQYDAIGRYAATEVMRDLAGNAGATVSVDRVVSVFTTRVAEATRIDGPVEMSRFISESEAAQRCFLTQSLRFGDGRMERIGEGCSLERARRLGGPSLREQISAFAASKAFQQMTLND